jgi:hypothetical protein
MFPASRRFRLGLAALLVAAPLAEVVESLLSPLTDGSTADDLRAIAAHQSVFVVSVLVGTLATVLYVPAFVGLARLTWERSRVLSAVGGAIAVLSMLGFMGVRMLQAFELEAVRRHLPVGSAARLVDGAGTNTIGGVLTAVFLGGSVVGVVCIAVAVWRARLAPVPAAVLLVAFPFVDLLAPGHLGTVVSHAVLLVALGWIGLSLARDHRIVAVPVGGSARVGGDNSMIAAD